MEKQLEALEENRQAELFALQASYEKKLQVVNRTSEVKLEKQRQDYEEQLAELRQKLVEANTPKESSNGASGVFSELQFSFPRKCLLIFLCYY